MTRKLFVFLFLICTATSQAQIQYSLPSGISEESKIYLVTCGPGSEVWSHFGHTAIEVHDPVNDFDISFNYGMFRFDDNFVYKFAVRDLDYYLHVSTTEDFVQSYIQEDRSVYRHELLISYEAKKQLYEHLRQDYIDPERRFYLYEFFYDNCATRPRDAIEDAVLDGNPSNWFTHPHHEKFSFREVIDKQFESTPWLDFGIDLVLGSPVDKQATSHELMFYPLYLTEIAVNTKVNGKPLVGEQEILYKGNFESPEPFWLTPKVVFWTLFVIILIFYILPYKPWIRYADVFLLLIFGLLGSLLLFMWTETLWPGTKDNYNLIWANPLHLLTIPILFLKKIREKIWWYFPFMAAVLFLFILTFWFMPQGFHPASKPIVLILMIIYYRYHKLIRNKVSFK